MGVQKDRTGLAFPEPHPDGFSGNTAFRWMRLKLALWYG